MLEEIIKLKKKYKKSSKRECNMGAFSFLFAPRRVPGVFFGRLFCLGSRFEISEEMTVEDKGTMHGFEGGDGGGGAVLAAIGCTIGPERASGSVGGMDSKVARRQAFA